MGFSYKTQNTLIELPINLHGRYRNLQLCVMSIAKFSSRQLTFINDFKRLYTNLKTNLNLKNINTGIASVSYHNIMMFERLSETFTRLNL